jgi:NADPH:quinone reductase-like Zn-dependent oxidoreductase
VKAAVIFDNGGLDQVVLADVPDPRPEDGEVLIELRAAALNHLDIWVRRGRPGLELSLPHILGSDGAGVVIGVGHGVSDFEPGDEVVINPGLSCGECAYCLKGEQSECINFGIVGMSCPGTFAERIVLPAVNVRHKPKHLSWEEAAAFPLAYVTAWRMLMSRARVRPGETVLIHGIGGGVALAALQLAKIAGAKVIVTSSSNDKLLRAKELGADHAVNYATSEDVALEVRLLAAGLGVDVIIDAVGAATWPVNFNAVRRGGRIVHCGVTTGAQAETNLSTLYWNQITVMGSTMGSHEDFRLLTETIDAARLHPILDSVEPLERVRHAMGRMEAGEQFGKIVLTPHLTVDAESFERALHEPRSTEPSREPAREDEPALTSVTGEDEEQE